MLSRSVDNLVFDCHVSYLLIDHSAVHWFARASRPVRPKKAVTFRYLKSLVLDLFATDLLNLQLFTADTNDVTTLLEWYNDGLTVVLNKHAPIQKRVFTIHPDSPCNNADIPSMRKQVRWLERSWKLSAWRLIKRSYFRLLLTCGVSSLMQKWIFSTPRSSKKLRRSRYLRLLIHSFSRSRLFDFT